MTRTGKIARLPRYLRDSLNQRLHDGESGKKLAAWLNSLPAVKDVLEEYFNEVPISEQNLSEWKQGGYQDWVKHEESLAWVRQLTEEADDLAEESGPGLLSDRCSGMLALALGKMLAKAVAKPLEEDAVRQEILSLAREISLLRRDDQRAAQLRMEQEVHARQETAAKREEEKRVKKDKKWDPLRELIDEFSFRNSVSQFTNFFPPEAAQKIRDYLDMVTAGPPQYRPPSPRPAEPEPTPDSTQSK